MDYSVGVEFTPLAAQNLSNPVSLTDLPNDLEYAYIYWVDMTNIRRCRIVPIDYFLSMMQSNRPGINIQSASAVGLVYLNVPSTLSSLGEYLYAIDKNSFRVLYGVSESPVLAALGYLEHKDPHPTTGEVSLNLCPRSALQRISSDILDRSKVEFLVGFETEFILLKSTNPIVASSIHQFSGASGVYNGSKGQAILQEIASALRKSGIPVQMVHAEAAPGQYEVTTGPLLPLEAADNLVYTREIIANIAAKHGLHATFAPRPFNNAPGSSAHTNISVHAKGDFGVKSAQDLSGAEGAFIQGVMDHLPAIVAFTLPSYASYSRVVDNIWSGGTFVSYGTENREASIRIVNRSSPRSRRFECRFVDGTSNPYLALAAIFAGAQGSIHAKAKLTMKDAKDKTAFSMTSEEREEFGISQRLPGNVQEARKRLADDSDLGWALGLDFVRVFASVSETLEKALMVEGEDNSARLTRLVELF